MGFTASASCRVQHTTNDHDPDRAFTCTGCHHDPFGAKPRWFLEVNADCPDGAEYLLIRPTTIRPIGFLPWKLRIPLVTKIPAYTGRSGEARSIIADAQKCVNLGLPKRTSSDSSISLLPTFTLRRASRLLTTCPVTEPVKRRIWLKRQFCGQQSALSVSTAACLTLRNDGAGCPVCSMTTIRYAASLWTALLYAESNYEQCFALISSTNFA